MRTSIVMQAEHLGQLRQHLLQDPEREHAAFLIGGFSLTAANRKLLVKEVVPIPGDGFREQSEGRLVIEPAFFNSIIKRAAMEGWSVILTHSHPKAVGAVAFSPIDNAGEKAMFANLFQRASGRPHGSLVFGANSVAARIWEPDGRVSSVDRLVVVGQRLEILPFGGLAPAHDPLHDRQARAFGVKGQERLADVTCGVVGGGGTGSATVEQLIRLGVRRLLVIDDDRVEPSNVSRIFGSRVEDARNRIPKVEVLRRLAEDIGVGTAIEAVQGSIVDAQVAAHLRDADVVFCCTDTHWSRCILNQFADQYLTPVIDMGNRIHAVNGRIQAADGRVYVVLPGGTCLWCCEAIRSDAVRTESLPDEERSRLEREGYVRGFEIGSPSVISLNAVVSGLAVTEFINLMTGFMGRETQPQLIYNMLGNSVKHGVYRPAGTCDCSTGRVRAKGDLDKLPCRTQNQVEDGCEVKAV